MKSDSRYRGVPEKVAIATTTRYNPDSEEGVLRAGLAEDTIRDALELGYDVSVIDGGSADEFLQRLEAYGAHIEAEEGNTMGAGRRQALRKARDSGRMIVAWTEPEKVDYVGSIAATSLPIIEGAVDLVVPERKSLESYPVAQQHSERFGNAVFQGLTGRDLDVFIGPRTIGEKAFGYFLGYDGEYGDLWDSIFIPVLESIYFGGGVIGVPIDFEYPEEQRRFEERHAAGFNIKRLAQLDNLVPALIEHWKKLTSSD